MLFFAFILMIIAGLLMLQRDDYNECIVMTGVSLVVVFGICAIISIIVISVNCIGSEGVRLAYEQRYESLIYKARTESIRDEFGIINKDYIDEIQAWNENVVKLKNWEKDFWIGIFVPNIYGEFETIDLSEISYKE